MANCDHSKYLDQAFRDMFVCGLLSDRIQRCLLTESDLSFMSDGNSYKDGGCGKGYRRAKGKRGGGTWNGPQTGTAVLLVSIPDRPSVLIRGVKGHYIQKQRTVWEMGLAFNWHCTECCSNVLNANLAN